MGLATKPRGLGISAGGCPVGQRLARFGRTSSFQHFQSDDLPFGPKEYRDKMKVGQNDICYITNECIRSALINIPGNFAQKGLEVLYMVDPVDEYCVRQLKEFDDKT